MDGRRARHDPDAHLLIMTTTPTAAEPARTGLSPRQRRRISLGIQYAVFVLVLVAVGLLADWPRIFENFLNGKVAAGMFPTLFTVALKNTLIFTVAGYVIGFVLGLVLALMRLSSVAPYRVVALVYIEIFRGLPALIIFLLLGFGLPIAFPGFKLPGDVYGTVALALGLVAAAYMAESFRAGIQAVPKGQMEAARSLGMKPGRAMLSIILPQAIRIVIPPLTNELILLFKDSSLVFTLGVTAATTELTKFGSDTTIDQANSTPLIVAGATYLLITIPLGFVVRRLEARQGRKR
ncbi:amino acid ABC transporter permease [Nonomuraea sp. NEAU-A123]|uniref:amino acid ABC transporter permease n=1 Tax=Nonomuraea sp. NEAU-A123 TaxID=2839649 RepID=UPI0027E13BD9|nr:amino acid ABC transporter permease [Nonomuraea sp. NEAU-A123]